MKRARVDAVAVAVEFLANPDAVDRFFHRMMQDTRPDHSGVEIPAARLDFPIVFSYVRSAQADRC
jgi:hypothetical protein